PRQAKARHLAVVVFELRPDGQEDLVIANARIAGERGHLKDAGIPVHQHATSEQREQRATERAPEIPHEVGAAGGFADAPRADSARLRGLERPLVDRKRRIEHQQRAATFHSQGLHAGEERADSLLVARRISRRAERLEPEDVVAQRVESEEVLQAPGPSRAVVRICGQPSERQDDVHGLASGIRAYILMRAPAISVPDPRARRGDDNRRRSAPRLFVIRWASEFSTLVTTAERRDSSYVTAIAISDVHYLDYGPGHDHAH